MQLKINGSEYNLYFGVGFVRELDKKYFLTSMQGIKFGQGLDKGIPELLGQSHVTLSDMLHAATVSERQRPVQAEVDKYIDDLSVEELEQLFDEVIEELKKQNIAGAKIKMIEDSVKLLQQTVPKEKDETPKKSTKKL